MQPTFLPWIGWFDLMDQVDIFIILDDVEFSKQSWQQRNQIRTSKGLEYLTVPVKTADRFGQRIIECQISDDRFTKKFLGSIRANYARAPHFKALYCGFEKMVSESAESKMLVDLNCGIIRWCAAQLDISTPLITASSLHEGGYRGEHVARLCNSVGASEYLSPRGAYDYLLEDSECFLSRDIRILFQSFQHPAYIQCFSPFIPYASVIDLIFNAGPDAIEIMRRGRREPISMSEVPSHEN